MPLGPSYHEHEKWEDLRFPANTTSILGFGDDPDWATYVGGTSALAFDGAGALDEEVHIIAQMPHARKEGSGIRPHVHWAPSDGSAGNVRWGLEYTWANINAVHGATTTIYCTDAAAGAGNTHQVASFAEIDGTGKTLSSIFIARLFRNATDAGDTYNNQDAFLLEFDIHYIRDSRGSQNEFSK